MALKYPPDISISAVRNIDSQPIPSVLYPLLGDKIGGYEVSIIKIQYKE